MTQGEMEKIGANPLQTIVLLLFVEQDFVQLIGIFATINDHPADIFVSFSGTITN